MRLREQCPNTEFFLVRIFLYPVRNTGKYGPEKTTYLDTFSRSVGGMKCHFVTQYLF